MNLKLPKFEHRFISLAVLFVILVLIMPRTAKFGYDYKKGTQWPYETLVAQFDFPILKTPEQIEEERENAGTSVVPYYRKSQERTNTVIKGIETLDFGKHASLKQPILSRVREIYETGVLSDAKIKLDKGSAALSREVIFVQSGKRAQKFPVSEVYKVSDAQNKLMAEVSRSYPSVNVDSLLDKSGVYGLIIPNLEFDRSMTELSHAESADYISPTSGYVNADQKIVSKGEIVTAEIAQILDSYKEEYNKMYGYDGPRILMWLGNILIALALVVILYFSIYYTNRDIFKESNRYYYLLTIFLLTALAGFFTERISPHAVYIVPFAVTALYLQAFFHRRVVLPVYIVSLLPLLIFAGNGVELFVMFLTAGVVTLYTFNYFNRGWLQFINALIIFIVLVVVYLGFRLIDPGSSEVGRTILNLFFGSLLTVAFYPLIFLFEKTFNLVSNTRLQELADTNNKILQDLSSKAPGTFQHSLQVMNMADAATRSIGGNVLLVRAGALYHDLGKMANPLCFIENESGVPGARRYHDGLTAKQSAQAIIRHVSDGMEIAKENGLPEVITDFILTHHGTASTGYFYNKYLNEGGDPADVADFFYPGKKPSSKEQVILMLCDSIEAASRTLKEFTPDAFDAFVERIVEGKMKDGQLDQAEISIRELEKVKSVLKAYLGQLYHERIEYPNREKG
ncbi:MAG: HDIG domain-containing protein [Bacteroidales bacterium]|nr:HDIG domain-containing protein [Bacteroidales bacterium]